MPTSGSPYDYSDLVGRQLFLVGDSMPYELAVAADVLSVAVDSNDRHVLICRTSYWGLVALRDRHKDSPLRPSRVVNSMGAEDFDEEKFIEELLTSPTKGREFVPAIANVFQIPASFVKKSAIEKNELMLGQHVDMALVFPSRLVVDRFNRCFQKAIKVDISKKQA